MGPDREQLEAVCEAVLDIYGTEYAMAATKPSAYLVDDLLVCVLQESSDRSPPDGEASAMASRSAFQWANQERFTDVVQGVTGRRVATFMSANHVSKGVFAELFFLEPVRETVEV